MGLDGAPLPLPSLIARPTLSYSLPPPSHQADRECLEHIVYDFGDTEMMNAMRPSIEEAQPVQTQELALDYIGEGRGAFRF